MIDSMAINFILRSRIKIYKYMLTISLVQFSKNFLLTWRQGKVLIEILLVIIVFIIWLSLRSPRFSKLNCGRDF